MRTRRAATAVARRAPRARTRSPWDRHPPRARRLAIARCRSRRRAAQGARAAWPAHGTTTGLVALLQVVPALERGFVATLGVDGFLFEDGLAREVVLVRPAASGRARLAL